MTSNPPLTSLQTCSPSCITPLSRVKPHSALTPASYQDLDNRATEEQGADQQAAGVSPKRQKVTTTGTTATDLEAEIAAKQAQLAALLRDQSQAGSSTTPGKQKKQISTHLPVTNAYLI